MYRILVETEFQAAHGVERSGGGREQPHEHLWRVQAAVNCRELDQRQMGIDFLELKPLLEDIVGKFEGRRLEQHKAFKKANATAEMVARLIYDQLAPKLPPEKKLAWIEVTEAPGCRVRYLPD